MKTFDLSKKQGFFNKITAIAVITVLAALSCAPEVELTKYDYDQYDQQFDPKLNTSVTAITPITFTGSTMGNNPAGLLPTDPSYKKQTVVATFEQRSDVLKLPDSKLEAEMKKFLHFYTVSENSASRAIGYTSTLVEINEWKIEKRAGPAVTIKMKDNFALTDSSLLVAKVDATTYTFSNGAKMDRDGNGVAGEAFYDDWYTTSGLIVASGTPHSFYSPTNKSWTISLSNPFSGNFNNTSNPAYTDAVVAYPNWSFVETTATTDELRAEYETILSGLAANFRVEKNTDGKGWVNAGLSVTYKRDDRQFQVASLTRENNTAYRVVYEGATQLESAKPYYGGIQRIRVIGDNPGAENNKHDPGFARTDANFCYNTDANAYVGNLNTSSLSGSDVSVTTYSYDNVNQNVVIDISVPKYRIGIASGLITPYFHLKEMTLAEFKENFKIVVATNSLLFADVDYLHIDVNYYFVDIEKVEFRKSDTLEANIRNYASSRSYSGFDVIRVTLDPTFKRTTSGEKYLYTNKNVMLTDNVTMFGTATGNNWEFGFHALTPITIP